MFERRNLKYGKIVIAGSKSEDDIKSAVVNLEKY